MPLTIRKTDWLEVSVLVRVNCFIFSFVNPHKTYTKKTYTIELPMTETTLKLKGMSCAACASNIESIIAQVAGISSIQVNFAAEQASIEYDESSINIKKIQAAISDAGYEASARDNLNVRQEDIRAQEEREKPIKKNY